MSLFETTFETPIGTADTNQLFARNEQEANRLIGERHLGETLSGVAPYTIKLASDWLVERNYPQAIHAAVWEGYIACAAGVAMGYEFMCEGGILHDLAHLNINRGDARAQAETFDRVRRKLADLERRTPGFYRPHAVISGSMA